MPDTEEIHKETYSLWKMLKIFAFVLPLCENLRNDFLLPTKELGFSPTLLAPRTLRTRVIKDKFVSTKTINPIIGLSWGNQAGLLGSLIINSYMLVNQLRLELWVFFSIKFNQK